MIWLIGNKGMLGSDVEKKIKKSNIPYFASDIEIDITDYPSLEYFVKDKNISWIINCSAYTAVDKAEDEPDLAYKINSEGVFNIAKIAKEKKAKLIHISTDYVFDGRKEGEYQEDDEPNPTGIYGKSKLKGEINILDNLDQFFIIRISWLYGENGKNFVYTMLGLFKDKSELKVVNDQYGNPTYTKDVAENLVEIVLKNSEFYGIYHFSNEGKTSWFNYASEIYQLAKDFGIIDVDRDVNIIPVNTEEFPTKAKRPANSCMSKEKIKNTFDIEIPQWQESLKLFLNNIHKH